MEVYVYALQGPAESWQHWADMLGKPLYHWVADAARLTVGSGIPDDWKDQGSVFGPQGELRWWRTEKGYQTLLLTDAPVEGLSPVEGEWRAEEEYPFLQNLREPRLNPNFPCYPNGAVAGQCRARVYYRNGVVTFISPRELVAEGGHDAER